MNSYLRTPFLLITLSLCLASVALADLKVRQKNTTGGQTYESTVMIKGARQRSESAVGAGQTSILQCDLRRTLLINDNTRRYLVYPLDGGDAAETNNNNAPAATTPVAPVRRGGTVTYTTTIVDTGERRQMFGLTARHLKTKMTSESSPDACDQNRFRLETDGWYTDFEYGLNCPANIGTMSSARPQGSGCQDRLVTKQVGAGRLGFPLSVTTTSYGPDGQITFTSTSEVLELARTPLEAALFDVPAGYTLARNSQELYGLSAGDAAGALAGQEQQSAGSTTPEPTTPAMPATKSPGAIRIGVAQVKNLTDKNISPDTARAQLVSALTAAGLEAVPLNAYTPAALDAEAKQKECDFFLTTDLTGLKLSAARKLGGLLGRATGVGEAAGVDRTEAQVSFKLTPVGATKPQLQTNASAKEAGDEASLKAALDKEAQAVAAEARKKK
ncbi:MAG TPA: hypothetical protein VF525_15950 [Pyrinomonadaceae bacterium]|jgi:hypothetical protein